MDLSRQAPARKGGGSHERHALRQACGSQGRPITRSSRARLSGCPGKIVFEIKRVVAVDRGSHHGSGLKYHPDCLYAASARWRAST